MAQRSVTREVPKHSRAASFEPSTVNKDKRTVDLIWTTGAPVKRGWYDPYWEELSTDAKHVRMERLNSGAAPLLNSHGSYDISQVLGVVEEARLEKGKGVATVRFDSGPEGEDAFRRVQEGTLRNVSVGYSTYKMQKVESGEANGKDIPTYRAIDWEPFEISLVPIGADAGAVTRSAAAATSCEFIEERAMEPKNETANPTTTTAPVPTPAPTPALTDAQRAQFRQEAEERILGIQKAGRALKRPQTEIDDAIAKGTSVDVYRAAAINAHAEAETIVVEKRATGTMIAGGDDARDKFARGALAWLIQRAGQAEVVSRHTKKIGKTIDLEPGEFRGMKLLDLARRSLELAGISTAGLTQMELAGKALAMRSITGGASASDFPVLLENTLNKTLLASYDQTPNTWQRFCKTGSVTDFRASNRYRRGSFGPLDKVGENGEFQRKAIPDGEKQSITAGTKGDIIAISRQTLVNDDMNAFDSLATDFGSSAAWSVELDVYAELGLNAGLGRVMTDGSTLFHANHNNITTPAALGSQAIDADRVAMARQKDVSKQRIISMTPAILLVPLELEGQAKQINNGQYDYDALNTKNPWTPNKVNGVFRDIVGTAQLTGTRRYLFADPALAPCMEVVFLDGQQTPYMEMRLGFDVDGIEWKVRLDYGVGPIDWRAAITNAGA